MESQRKRSPGQWAPWIGVFLRPVVGQAVDEFELFLGGCFGD
jgi:hypothetical protein